MTDTIELARPDAFNQLGAIARDLLESLRELGSDRSLGAVAAKIPDARDRLTYVGKLTEDAAHKVLATGQRTPVRYRTYLRHPTNFLSK